MGSVRRAIVAAMLLALASAALPRTASAFCFFNCDYTKTKYPIVLAHGLGGFDELFGVYDYWYGIPSALADGGARVFVTQVSPLNSPQARGEQLIDQIETIVAITGKAKVNLIGHSQGGIDIRYVRAVRPDLVASVTTVGSPHTGSKTADAAREMSRRSGVPAALANLLSGTLAWLSGEGRLPQDALGALQSLDSEGAAVFNKRFPQGQPLTPCGEGPAVENGVRYFSFGGTRVGTNPLDPSDAVLLVTSRDFGDEANDGLVGRCASHWGVVLRDDYEWNHLDEVNQALGLRATLSPDPRAVYRLHANRLQRLGL
jgi:triacylglycerol lipase